MEKKIILGITGSIAAYKAADLTSKLIGKSYDVHVAMTQAATKFITPLTLQVLSKNFVHTDVIEEHQPHKIQHIELVRRANLFVIAPATANMIAKLANGIADDMISTMFLVANPKQVIVAPAMNTTMYEHPTVKQNIDKLSKMGVKIISPKTSLLACGEFGTGALADTLKIIDEIEAHDNITT